MQAFSNIRVIDLTHVIAGPFCTYQLAVLGADVIKIESPHSPDMCRKDGATPVDNARGMGSAFMAQNANKRSLAVDLKSTEGREIVLELIRGADVVVENYRSGALASLGLGYDAVCKINPKIIYCSMTGYGQTGPKAQHTAYDNVIQAFSGLMAATGDAQTAPVRVGPPVLDYGTGAQAAFAVAAALYQRSQTGQGGYIDIAMLDSALMLMGANVTHYHAAGRPQAPGGNNSPSRSGYACYPTADGLLMIGAYTAAQHAAMWRVLGDETRALSADNASPGDLESDAEAITAALSNRTADQWENLMNESRVPAARVRSVDEALAHAQISSRSVLQQTGSCYAGPLPVAAFCSDSNSPKITAPPPEHGEHTREILDQLGYSEQRQQALAAQGVIARNNTEVPAREAAGNTPVLENVTD